MKEFGLYFRYRDAANSLCDVGMVCTAKSQKDAKTTGKNLERPDQKVWFIGLIEPQTARNTGGQLP